MNCDGIFKSQEIKKNTKKYAKKKLLLQQNIKNENVLEQFHIFKD